MLWRPNARVVPRDDVLPWVRSLPWVVERPYSLGIEGARTFAIDCAPLGVRQLWLVAGLANARLAIIVPSGLAGELERSGLASPVAPMPFDHAFVRIAPDTDAAVLETIVLASYDAALSFTGE